LELKERVVYGFCSDKLILSKNIVIIDKSKLMNLPKLKKIQQTKIQNKNKKLKKQCQILTPPLKPT
jgi:hypothetical protein